MTKVPSLSYTIVVKTLQKNGWEIIRQRGSHIRMHKRIGAVLFKLTVPARKPIKRSTLAHILKQAKMDINDFLELL